MAYQRGPVYSTDSSASLLPGNLSVYKGDTQDEVNFAVIHKHLAIVGQLGSSDSFTQLCHGKLVDKDPTSYLTQVKWCKLESSLEIIVLTSYKGIKIYNDNGSNTIYSNKFETPPGALSNRFAKGIASVGNSVYVGTSEGTILVFRVADKECGIHQVTLTGQLQGHKAAISDVVLSQPQTKACRLLTCDERGTISAWQDLIPGAKPALTIRESSGIPCYCLATWDSFIIGGFANGQVIFFDIQSGNRKLEMAVHARPITAIDIAQATGLMLTVSEDGLLTVWNLPVSDSQESLMYAEVIEDTLLCGGKFLDPEGNCLAVTAYDHSNICTFTKQLS